MNFSNNLIVIFLSLATLTANAQEPPTELLSKAEQGDTKAQNSLGYGYYEGKVFAKDQEKAIYWLRKSAEAGDSRGQSNLGFMYDNGYGVPKDAKTAVSWWEKAAAQGDITALVNLGNTYGRGDGLPKNMAKAAEYFKQAANKGDTYSMGVLGSLYANADGVKKDFKQARFWITKAAKAGNEEAKQNLQALDAMESTKVTYVEELHSKYGSRIIYETAFAKKTVQNFVIDCRRGNRVLPLENIILARLKQGAGQDKWMVARVQSRGDDVRIIDELVNRSGIVEISSIAFEVDKWGELRPHGGIRIEAMMNACFGSYGPISEVR